jgi:hypothetical protein
MDILKNITKRVTETAKVAAKKSSEMIEVTKLKMNIGSEEDKIEKAYIQMGKITFEMFENGESIDEVFKQHCEKIVSYKENIKAMGEQILQLRNIKICSACSAELECETAYCPKCGEKQEIALTLIEEETTNVEEIEIDVKEVNDNCENTVEGNSEEEKPL